MKKNKHNTFTQSLPSVQRGLGWGFFLFGLATFAQESDKTLPAGNEQFASNKFVDAEANYRVSTSKFNKKAIASYNLGNAIYKQKQNGEAKLAFEKAAKKAGLYSEKHNAYHNMGNALMNEKKYDEALEAYKNALRNNPNDEETRYNYALAKQKDKENPNKNKDKKKDNKKDKKDDPKQDPNKPDDKKQDNGKPKEEPGKISEERLKNMMEAVNNEEKRVQEKVKKQQGKPVQTDKDW